MIATALNHIIHTHLISRIGNIKYINIGGGDSPRFDGQVSGVRCGPGPDAGGHPLQQAATREEQEVEARGYEPADCKSAIPLAFYLSFSVFAKLIALDCLCCSLAA